MPANDARTVIASEAKDYVWARAENAPHIALELAGHILEALASAGYAVVPTTRTIDDEVRQGAFSAVARAVCPEHHAVYDTRTHAAVPVAEIEEAASALQKVASGQITGNNHSHRPWAQKRADALRSLLPTEESAGDA